MEAHPKLSDYAGDAIAVEDEIVDRLLEQPKIRLVLKAKTNRLSIEHPVSLRARCSHRRSLACIEDAKLDTGCIGRKCHRTTQGIDLFHEMALPDTPNRGIARHLTQRFEVVGQKKGVATPSRSGQGRLGTGMATADHDYIEVGRISHLDGQNAAALTRAPMIPQARS
jgi:hypothetical protein